MTRKSHPAIAPQLHIVTMAAVASGSMIKETGSSTPPPISVVDPDRIVLP